MLELGTISLLVGVSSLLYLRLRGLRRRNNTLISESQALRRSFQLQATTDELTGLGNRRALMRALSTNASQTCEMPQLCLARINVDGLRRYNEKFGYGAGDGLLARFGRNLAEKFDGGSAYRSGGAEFCVLWLSTPHPTDEELDQALADLTNEEDRLISGSYGRVLTPSGAANANDALRLAERCLYPAATTPPFAARGTGATFSRAPAEEGDGDLIARTRLGRSSGASRTRRGGESGPWSEVT